MQIYWTALYKNVHKININVQFFSIFEYSISTVRVDSMYAIDIPRAGVNECSFSYRVIKRNLNKV